MAVSTGVVLAMGAVVITNQVLVNNQKLNVKVVIAIGFAALGLAALEKASPDAAQGLAYIALITALITPVGGHKSPVENILSYTGFAP